MLSRRRRRRVNVETTLGKCLVLAGKLYLKQISVAYEINGLQGLREGGVQLGSVRLSGGGVHMGIQVTGQ